MTYYLFFILSDCNIMLMIGQIVLWMVTKMNNVLYNIKKLANNLGNNPQLNSEIKLLQELISSAEAYKTYLTNLSNTKSIQKQSEKIKNPAQKNPTLKVEKISEEVFLCKPVTVKNYYEGDYLERFSEIRTSDLKTCGVFEIHNKFWTAHEVIGGNIFASIPLALVNDHQSSKLQGLNWNKVMVDIYEIVGPIEGGTSRGEMINTVKEMFDHYILVREVYGNVFMVLQYLL